MYRSPLIINLLRQAIEEDLGSAGDLTAMAAIGPKPGVAFIVAREAGVMAGEKIPGWLLANCGFSGTVTPIVHDREVFGRGERILRIESGVQEILSVERTILNFLQRMCGIAWMTRKVIEKLANPRIQITDTRKTTPLFRPFQKWAVVCGGGVSHRWGLDSGLMLKENHLRHIENLPLAVKELRRIGGPHKILTIEGESLNQIRLFGDLDCDNIMLDNFNISDIAPATAYIRGALPGRTIEVSGGVTLDSISAYQGLDIDFISLGALTHSAPAVDLALDFE